MNEPSTKAYGQQMHQERQNLLTMLLPNQLDAAVGHVGFPVAGNASSHPVENPVVVTDE